MRKRVLALLAALMLSGCNFNLDAGALLEPPRLTEQQSAVYDALEAAIGTDAFKLKYPRSGGNLAACTLRDLDGDGVEEAIAFYELTAGASASTWLAVLVQQDGGWRCVRQIPGDEGEIDRLEFVDILGGASSILVGWTSAAAAKSTCMFYFYENGQVEKYKTNFSYNDLMIGDVDDDGREEVILCTRGKNGGTMALLHESGGRIVRTGTMDFEASVEAFEQIAAGELSRGVRAVFADTRLTDGSAETIVAVVRRGENRTVLEPLEESELGIYTGTTRPAGQAVCADVNGDGLIDLPVCTPLAGYSAQDEDVVWLTTYQSVSEGALVPVARVVTNTANGYRFRFPDAWDEAVTVRSYPVNGEWRFILYGGDLGDTSAVELLRIRVLAPSDYRDKLETAEYRTVAQRGVYEYQLCVPAGEVARYSISFEEAERGFSLLH